MPLAAMFILLPIAIRITIGAINAMFGATAMIGSTTLR
jgi:hypothetical protein